MPDFSPLWISLRIAAIATPIAVCLGIGAAYGIQRYRGRGRALIEGVLLAPMVLPPTVLGFLLLLLLGKNRPLGALLDRAGIDLVFTWYAAVITATIVALPLAYKTVLGAFGQIDANIQQAARTLGASELRLLREIALPLALPGLIAGTTLAFARALGEFGATLMLAGNIPGKTQTISMAIYFAVEAGAFGEAALWTGVIFAIALGGLWLANLRLTPDRSRVGNRISPAEREPIALAAPNPPLPFERSASGHPVLEVAIAKQLPGFTLEVSFTTDRHPLGLLGASGAGKSLILRCIAGTETPDSGRIVANGRVLFDSAAGIDLPIRDRRIGILFQNYALFPNMSAAENVAFGLPVELSRRQRRQLAERELAAVQLTGFGDRLPGELSGGQQQRVALARALASQPDVLLLDEPFSALDTHLRHLIERDLRLRLEGFNGTTLFVTHNIEEAYRLCDRLLVMDRGRALVCNSKATVLDRPETVRAASLTGCKNISRVVPLGPHTVRALDWDCTLQVAELACDRITHLGMRAHHIGFLETDTPRTEAPGIASEGRIDSNGSGRTELQAASAPSPSVLTAPNVFPCWLSATSETPHRVTLYLKLNAVPNSAQDYHLQAEVFKERWATLKHAPLPWSIQLAPQRLMMLRETLESLGSSRAGSPGYSRPVPDSPN
ncbi:molybdate ABC transporter, permease protein [Rubidibacter lacunae KORDI 51-2]|uniref:Molybdate ABC transporter, permease protein n=1 Tax=Rubidibacter lacunae KORDI 51-2 TaxID=582515 RepID=U5DBK7_9CHRO|nr:molybdate ABC transporter permease subunit [Rubidibacter lacunae]ERN41923.1 molybdate ABC transporter, permease protein [Rubidibacter lacunae KORDI 51-2]